MPDLFPIPDLTDLTDDTTRPLADILRPQSIEDVVGQDHLVGVDAPLTRIIKSGRIPSLIFWGPPGCGKTTLARILAHHTDLHFEQISAIFSGVADLKKVFEQAKIRKSQGRGTLLFVDEIHRFNKSQQDAFLPVVENGIITLIGATTENPSFELNAALLSRAQVLVLKRLDDAALEKLLGRAENHADRTLPLDDQARTALKALADGDGRYILTLTDQIFAQTPESKTLNQSSLFALVQKRAPLYDKGEDAHYNLISALHKSVRGSDVQAALYWFSRMLDGGEDPRYIARRMVRMAVEDVGLADPQAMPITLAAWEIYERLGSPEGELALSEALIYLATAPKSNANYMAYKAAKRSASDYGSLMPPKHILNAPTKLMKQQGYGTGYEYDHDTTEAFSGQNYFPDELDRTEFYTPPERGFEREINKRLVYWEKLRQERNNRS
ncbi:MAG TPA: replication-associated recombination protein A [Alphaproteobacteria bacterium]|nr:replication-associated recombination protein A [Alphaproteobacteria bacterium]HNS44916.1 replication-associated recombination protein A [Alphaproteobacteria bacterium]